MNKEETPSDVHLDPLWIQSKIIMQTQDELINLLTSQIVDLTMMSKIELGDDVIAEISRLKVLLLQNK